MSCCGFYLLFCVVHVPDALHAHVSSPIGYQITGGRTEYARRLILLKDHFVVIQIDLKLIPNSNIQSAAQLNRQDDPSQFIYLADNTGGFQYYPFLSSPNL